MGDGQGPATHFVTAVASLHIAKEASHSTVQVGFFGQPCISNLGLKGEPRGSMGWEAGRTHTTGSWLEGLGGLGSSP